MTLIWNVPYPRNPFFCGREDLLSDLTLRGFRHNAVLALTGLSGIGKTQIAVEYLFRYAHTYQNIFWFNASSRESMSGGIQSVVLREDVNDDQRFEGFQRWLDTQQQWLVVLDHLNDFELLDQFIPRQLNGHVLLTTRRHATGLSSGAIRVTPMKTDTGARLLLQRAGLLAASASLDQAPEASVTLARTLVREMGGVPLALDQAGAALQETGSSLAGVLASYRQHPTRVLSQREKMVDRTHPASLRETLQEIVPSLPPASLELLRLCAFLPAGGTLPQKLSVPNGLHVNQSLQGLAADVTVFHQAIAGLLRFSLLFQEEQTHRLCLYAPVQLLVREALTSQQQQEYQQIAEGIKRE